jgi:hypothetical protein
MLGVVAGALAAAITGCGVEATAGGQTAVRPAGPGVTQLGAGRPKPEIDRDAVLAHGQWSVLARSPLRVRYGPTVVWDGTELLEIGGTAGGRLGGAPRDSGAAYDPARSRWFRVAPAPAAVLPADAASVWTGHQVFIYGGPTLPTQAATNVAGLYDPSSNRWTVTGTAPVGPVNQAVAVWTGATVVLAGLTRGNRQRLEVASYDPATKKWTSADPPIRAGHTPLAIAMVNTDHGVLLWSMWGRTQKISKTEFVDYSGIDVYRLLSSGTWSNVTGSWPQHQTVTTPIFTGTQVLLAPGQDWCGACSQPPPFDEHGDQVNPTTLRLRAIPHGPLDDLGPQIIWTGTAEISFNHSGQITGPAENVRPGDIAIWNPTTRRWARGPRAPKQIGDAPAVWSGHQLLVLAEDDALLSYGN